MSFTFKKGILLVILLAPGVGAFARPAHVLYHAGKDVTYSVRHPQNTAHGLWKLVTAVF